MCGIVGFLEKRTVVDRNVLDAMVQTQLHRGPDDQGMCFFPLFSDCEDFAMGFDRLSILDVSLNGHQPMRNENDSVYLTMNGEIINAFDYRSELESRGYEFHSTTDTEVVLHLYEEYGIDGMLDRINGMFAICIADRNKKELFLIRDRFGVKPLYYWENENAFLYASEYKAFYAHPDFKNCLNLDVLAESLLFRHVSGKETLLRGVYNVLPAHYIKIDANGNQDDIEYWSLMDAESETHLSLKDYEHMIETAVQKRLISDVALGVQLSGGVDSSLVLHYARKKKEEQLKTFSIVFEAEQYTEKEWIDQAAAMNMTEQHQYTMTARDFSQLFESATWHCDAPLNHPNSIGIYRLCEEAKKEVTVLMTGEGADEVFGGYYRYSYALWDKRHPALSRLLCRAIGYRAEEGDFEDRCIKSTMFMSDMMLRKTTIGMSSEQALSRRRLLFEQTVGHDLEKQWLNYDLKTYLVDILNRQDKMSMAASVETRVPFLDYKLVEAVRQQKVSSYVNGAIKGCAVYHTKKPLKILAANIYGKRFAYRKKSGFPIPLEEYFADETFSNYVEGAVMPELEQSQLFRMDEIWKLWNNRMQCKKAELETLWILIAHGTWMRLFLHDKSIIVEFKHR